MPLKNCLSKWFHKEQRGLMTGKVISYCGYVTKTFFVCLLVGFSVENFCKKDCILTDLNYE